MLKKLIKSFDFISTIRPELIFSDRDKIRLNSDSKTDQFLSLKGGIYDMGEDNFVITPKTSPKRLKRWLGFEAIEEVPENTSTGYRLILSTGEKYYDGSAWQTPSLNTHWNDFKTINRHIKDLELTDTDLQIKIKLKSIDGIATPKVRGIKLLAEIFLVPWDDLIYDTIIRALRNSLRATTAIEFEVANDTSVIDLNSDLKLPNKGYNFTNIMAAYNISDDPKEFKNIALSYTPGDERQDGTFQKGQVTLKEEIAAGKIVKLEMEYMPDFAVYTNQDYSEPEKLPAIVFEKIGTIKVGNRHDQELNNGSGDFIRDYDEMKATIVPRPRQSTVRFEYAIWASPLDIARLIDAMERWVAENTILKSYGFDDTLNLGTLAEIETSDNVDSDNVVIANGIFQLLGVPFYLKSEKTKTLVQRFNREFVPT